MPRRVTDMIVGDGLKQLVDIRIDGDTTTATDGHPFWVDDKGAWIDAEELEPGDLSGSLAYSRITQRQVHTRRSHAMERRAE